MEEKTKITTALLMCKEALASYRQWLVCLDTLFYIFQDISWERTFGKLSGYSIGFLVAACGNAYNNNSSGSSKVINQVVNKGFEICYKWFEICYKGFEICYKGLEICYKGLEICLKETRLFLCRPQPVR